MADKPNAVQEASTRSSVPTLAPAPDSDALRDEIQLRAYYRYCERGCAPGADVTDWLAAEQEVLTLHAKPIPSGKASADDRRHDRTHSRAHR